MARLFVAFKEQNVRYGDSRWLLGRVRLMRFEWLALLALRRHGEAGDEGWVTTEEISRLPSWSGRSRHHVITNIGRYLQGFARSQIDIVYAKAPWAGPYQLRVKGDHVTFDVSLAEAARRLGVQSPKAAQSQSSFPRFTLNYARAQWLLFQGRLATKGPRLHFQEGAFGRLVGMMEDKIYSPKLRAIAWLAAVQVLFQIGRFELARKTLAEYRRLLACVRDEGLIARYWLALAWSHQRGASGRRSDRNTLAALRNAAAHLERTRDREVAGALSYRRSGYLTKHGRHPEAVAELLRALEAHLVTGNFQNVQACCVDIGSDLHRIDEDHYAEARHWILVGLAICRFMAIGRDNAHGETILGKMYLEQGKKLTSRLWIDRALRISSDANNMVSLGDAHMVMALWHQQFGREVDTIASIVRALIIFRGLKHFDCPQKEAYMARKFPEVWGYVLMRVGANTKLRKRVPARTNRKDSRPATDAA